MHRYAGLDVETANDFVARDLTESGSVLARLRVVRGVPDRAVCGHRIIWTPGRAWCLEPGRLPAEQKDRYARLLPSDRPIGQIEVARWPVSETSASTDPEAVSLLECSRCERLDAPDGPPVCPCGGTRRLVARRLLPSIAGAFGAWSRADPLPRSDTIRVYANERRRAPALVHHLTAMSGIDASGSEFGLTLVPTVNRIDLAAADRRPRVGRRAIGVRAHGRLGRLDDQLRGAVPAGRGAARTILRPGRKRCSSGSRPRSCGRAPSPRTPPPATSRSRTERS